MTQAEARQAKTKALYELVAEWLATHDCPEHLQGHFAELYDLARDAEAPVCDKLAPRPGELQPTR